MNTEAQPTSLSHHKLETICVHIYTSHLHCLAVNLQTSCDNAPPLHSFWRKMKEIMSLTAVITSYQETWTLMVTPIRKQRFKPSLVNELSANLDLVPGTHHLNFCRLHILSTVSKGDTKHLTVLQSLLTKALAELDSASIQGFRSYHCGSLQQEEI